MTDYVAVYEVCKKIQSELRKSRDEIKTQAFQSSLVTHGKAARVEQLRLRLTTRRKEMTQVLSLARESSIDVADFADVIKEIEAGMQSGLFAITAFDESERLLGGAVKDVMKATTENFQIAIDALLVAVGAARSATETLQVESIGTADQSRQVALLKSNRLSLLDLLACLGSILNVSDQANAADPLTVEDLMNLVPVLTKFKDLKLYTAGTPWRYGKSSKSTSKPS